MKISNYFPLAFWISFNQSNRCCCQKIWTYVQRISITAINLYFFIICLQFNWLQKILFIVMSSIQCSICLNFVNLKDDNIHTTTCGHIFHRPCLDQALQMWEENKFNPIFFKLCVFNISGHHPALSAANQTFITSSSFLLYKMKKKTKTKELVECPMKRFI